MFAPVQYTSPSNGSQEYDDLDAIDWDIDPVFAASAPSSSFAAPLDWKSNTSSSSSSSSSSSAKPNLQQYFSIHRQDASSEKAIAGRKLQHDPQSWFAGGRTVQWQNDGSHKVPQPLVINPVPTTPPPIGAKPVATPSPQPPRDAYHQAWLDALVNDLDAPPPALPSDNPALSKAMRLALPRFDWPSKFKRMQALQQAKYTPQRNLAASRIRPIVQVVQEEKRDITTHEGDERLRRILDTLDRFKQDNSDEYMIRSPEQKLFHLWYVQAFLPFIYGSQWEHSSEHALKEMSRHMNLPPGETLLKPHTEVFCLTPRRCGKTTSVAMFVAALLANVPGIRIGVFSTAQRVSSWLMQMVLRFINDIPGVARRIVKENQEELFVSVEELPPGVSCRSTYAHHLCNAPSTSRFYSFPANVDSKC